jgi:hypothetical protein
MQCQSRVHAVDDEVGGWSQKEEWCWAVEIKCCFALEKTSSMAKEQADEKMWTMSRKKSVKQFVGSVKHEPLSICL